MAISYDTKASYIIEGRLSKRLMGCPSGSVLMCDKRTDNIDDIFGETALICLEDGGMILCQIEQGSSRSKFDLFFYDEIIDKDASIIWAEPITGSIHPGIWQKYLEEDPDHYYRWTATHSIPVLHICEGGRATLQTGADA